MEKEIKEKLIIYGIGKFAEYVAYAFDQDSEYKVVAFSVEKKLKTSNLFSGKPLIEFEKLQELGQSN